MTTTPSALLDSVQVGMPGSDNEKYPLRDFATVGTRDGALVVTLYDPDVSVVLNSFMLPAGSG